MICFCAGPLSETAAVRTTLPNSAKRPVLGPVDGCVVHDIFAVGDLHQDTERNRATRNSFHEFVEQEVLTAGSGSGIRQIVGAGFRHDPVAPKVGKAILYS